MSATPADVKPVIAEKEYCLSERILMTNPSMKLYQLAKKIKIIEYYFKADYDHVNLNFFYEWKSIEKRILDEKDSAYKWLIFINSKDIGKQIRKNLTKQLASYIDAESNKPKLQALTRTQFFEKKVLISTSVIDNGISIYDDKLKNIVVDFSDKVQ